MDIKLLSITQITSIISIAIFLLCAIYYYVAAKKKPVLEPHKSDYLEKAKEYERYMIISNRNLNIGLIIGVLFMLLSILINLIGKTQ